jgi:hypothetical protein
MKEPLALYIGTIRRGEFESLLQRDIPVGVILDTNSSIKLPVLDALRVVEYCDCNHIETELLPLIDRLSHRWEIHCVLTTHEQYVLPATYVTQHLDLPGLSLLATQFCLDKTSMHERFVREMGPDATACFAHIESQEELQAFARTVYFPVILKPANLYNSLFVTLSFSQEELLTRYIQMIDNMQETLRKTGRSSAHPQIQAEEFLEGTVHSVDCIVDFAGQVVTTPIVDIITGHEIGWDDFHHFARFTPSRLSASQQQALLQLAVEGVKALEITSTVAHVEIIQTVWGPKLLEIGARPGGGRAHLLHLSSGFDLMYHYYRVRCGEACGVSQAQGQSLPTAVVSPYARTPGRLMRINRLADIQRLPTYRLHEQKIPPGQPVGPSTLGYTAPLTIELQAENAEMVSQDIQTLQSWSDIFQVADGE